MWRENIFSTNLFSIDINHFYDLSINLSNHSPNAFYQPNPDFKIFKEGSFIGSVLEGGSCNVDVVTISPHGNGTHTECCGHISTEHHFISKCDYSPFLYALLIDCKVDDNNQIVPIHLLEGKDFLIGNTKINTLIVRSQTHQNLLKHKNWSGVNAPYLSNYVMEICHQQNIEHLLVDVPSIDGENDSKLTNHHFFFWNSKENHWNENKTITEMICVLENIKAGPYLLNLQYQKMDTDAVPSRPIIFPFLNYNYGEQSL